MIITFCGHSEYFPVQEDKIRMIALLEKLVGDEAAEFFLGGYDAFDAFAYQCCKKYKEIHPNVSLVFVTPYMHEEYIEAKKGHIR